MPIDIQRCQLHTCDTIQNSQKQACSGINAPGVCPVEYKCLVLPITVEEVTAGGIIMPSQVVDAEQIAATEGTLIAVGGMAFDDWKDVRKPAVGDKLLIAKYAGVTYKGKDKREYRILNDKDILAILE